MKRLILALSFACYVVLVCSIGPYSEQLDEREVLIRERNTISRYGKMWLSAFRLYSSQHPGGVPSWSDLDQDSMEVIAYSSVELLDDRDRDLLWEIKSELGVDNELRVDHEQSRIFGVDFSFVSAPVANPGSDGPVFSFTIPGDARRYVVSHSGRLTSE